ncbi:MAG: hypothetical protein ACYCW6_23965 [Candidatus Xenobia bacterium]
MAARQRGVALVTVLWVSALLAALCMAFLMLVLTQSRFQGHETDQTRATYAARSGVEYLATRGLDTLQQQQDGTWLLPFDNTSECVFTRDAGTHVITCRGMVTNGHGHVFAWHDTVVPPDNLDAFADRRAGVAPRSSR